MILTEYDEKLHLKNTYEEGRETGYHEGRETGYHEGREAGYREGEQAGEYALLEKQIRKKVQRGKSAAAIAEELEVELNVVEEILSGGKKR